MGAGLKGYDIIGIYNLAVHYDRFRVVIIMIIASIYTGSHCLDVNCHMFRYLVLARNKDFLTTIFKPEPTYLGESIPVSGDGNSTNDKQLSFVYYCMR